MRFHLLLFFFVCPFVLNAQNKTIHFMNGNWFNGTGFEKQEFYSVNGSLTKTKPATVDTVINLGNQYIIPPFGEAHNHSPDVEEEIEVFIERYLADGIFYIKNPNSIPFTTKRISGKINHPQSVDVVYANGGLTSSFGHPVALYEYLLTTVYKKSVPKWTTRSMEGAAYYIINTKEDLEKKWPFILADKPGFIKVYLLYSEEYEKRKTDSFYNGKKGLNPFLLKQIVKKATAAGLKVSCHAETPADLKFALKAGVTEMNHLPGYQVRWKEGYEASYYKITPALAKLMKRKQAHADATYSLAETELYEKDSVRYSQRRTMQIKNLLLLKKFQVPVTIACDSYNLTAKTEIEYLHQLQVYSNLELLKMWSEVTPLAIFPNRKIAALKEGYEASFLVLKNNPLENFDALFNISLRVKQGTVLW